MLWSARTACTCNGKGTGRRRPRWDGLLAPLHAIACLNRPCSTCLRRTCAQEKRRRLGKGGELGDDDDEDGGGGEQAGKGDGADDDRDGYAGSDEGEESEEEPRPVKGARGRKRKGDGAPSDVGGGLLVELDESRAGEWS